VSRRFVLAGALLAVASLLAGCAISTADLAAQAQPTPLPALAPGDQGPCTPENADRPRPTGKARLVIATGGTGGVYFPYGGGLARVLSAKMPRTEVTAEVTGGSVDNNKLIFANEADLAMTTVDSAYDAVLGAGVYRDTGPVPACTIATLYQSFLHVVALDGTGINGVPDLKGKRVSVGSAGSSTEVAADRVLEAAGIDSKTGVTRDTLSVAESVNAMKDRKIDAFFWIGGLPTAAVTDLVATPGVKVNFLSTEEYVQGMRDKHGPVYTPFALPRATYSGMQADVPGTGIGNILFVNANMSPELVADILKAIFDNLADVRGIHPEAKWLDLETAATGSSIPYHPGAINFYRERGVWKQ
jgi:uncharacterized protein